MALDRWIRLLATQEDREMLERIAELDGNASMGATVRRLIREECNRRHIAITSTFEQERQLQVQLA